MIRTQKEAIWPIVSLPTKNQSHQANLTFLYLARSSADYCTSVGLDGTLIWFPSLALLQYRPESILSLGVPEIQARKDPAPSSQKLTSDEPEKLLTEVLTIGILSRGKCGLSKCVTRYLVAMSAADLLVIILDLILRHIPIVYLEQFQFLWSIPVCNIHAVLLYAATDCSVWFTVAFTFDRFVAICCQKLKSKYCSERTSAVAVGTVTVLSCLKNIFWYFMLTGRYSLQNDPWFCDITMDVLESFVWIAIEFLHNILTPAIPFALILLLNALTVRHILVSSRGRRRLRAHSSGESRRDSEMESRRKSIILLLVISGNFILLWALLMAYSLWSRMWYLGYQSVYIPDLLLDLSFMLELLSCCTNTAIYAVTQSQFREQLKKVLKYPFTAIAKFIQC
ncbi:probable G-protein coupled receptor 139 [Heterodontus francisci]|uniref:probable G-protein coupled receptor 139 n=1 Tax=Heterodontus francisci TaxID=7792 RepID=UPI00355B230F